MWFLLFACTARPPHVGDATSDTASPAADGGADSHDTGSRDTGDDTGGDGGGDGGSEPDPQCPDGAGGTPEGELEYARYPVFIVDTDRRFLSIQDAIWGAEEGQIVAACPGTYRENIDFKGKQITVRGHAGPWLTTIDGSGGGAVVEMRNYEGPDAILEGFTVTGGAGTESHGGGIFVEWGSPTIRYNIVVDNHTRIAGGIYVRNGAASVHHNVVAWNSASEGGGGIVCTACSGDYSYNTVYENESADGPIAEYFWGIATLRGNILVAPDGAPGAAIRYNEPRSNDFDTAYNLLWPDMDVVRGQHAESWPGTDGWIVANPGLADPSTGDWRLSSDSPATDAGPPDELDADGSPADLGAFGGADGQWPWSPDGA